MRPDVVLASGSPRRKALLAALGVPFEVVLSDAEEIFEGPTPREIVITNARAKRDQVVPRVQRPSVIIAADTLVFLDEHVLGKPANLEEARRMLRMLSGRTHQVLTGLAVIHTGTGATVEGSETTQVTFRALSDAEIDRFVEVVQPTDRAGAYTVDGPGSLLVAGYQGCYQNVLGFPMVRLDALLRDVGVCLFDYLNADTAVFL